MATTNPLTIGLAGPILDHVLRGMYPAFAEPRFSVAWLASDWGQFQERSRQNPVEAIVVDAGIAPDPKALGDLLAAGPSLAYVILPPMWESARDALDAADNVHAYVGSVDFMVLRERIATDVNARRALHRDSLVAAPHLTVQASTVTGTRIFAVIGKGGSGKSTLTTNLASALARAGLRTLYVDLDQPGAGAPYFNLPPVPNAMTYFSTPSLETFRAAIQKVGTLDVLLGPQDGVSAAEVASRGLEDEGSVASLIRTAASDGYAAVLLDLPADTKSEFSLQAIMTANGLLVVCRPAVVNQVWAIQTMALIHQLSGQHRIPRDRMFLVVNAVRPEDNLSPNDFHKAVDSFFREQYHTPYPPIIGVLPFDATIRNTQNSGGIPFEVPETSEQFRRAVRALADTLFPGTGAREEPAPSRVLKLPWGIKVKVR